MSEILCRLDHAGLFLPGDTERKPILRDITWDIHAGEHSVLIGGNGAGKSTLMKLMVGLLKPNSGTVSLFGEAIGDKKAEDLSRQISLVYQNPEEMFIKDSIRADIAYAMEVRKVPEWEKRTAELLERFRLTELADLIHAEATALKE